MSAHPPASSGTKPAGTRGEEQASRWVRVMFDRVAPRYDLINHVLSFQLDRYWRNRTVRAVRDVLAKPDARIVDLCCGTGDLLLTLERKAAAPAVYGSDFSHAMLRAAREKSARRHARTALFEADALSLPVADGSLDLITVAFGFRNLANYRGGLAEFRRALKSGGVLAILEFSHPRQPLFAAMYRWYSHRVLPAVGGLISGSREAYTYLPESVDRFPDAEQLASAMRESGFAEVRFELMTGGIVALHVAR